MYVPRNLPFEVAVAHLDGGRFSPNKIHVLSCSNGSIVHLFSRSLTSPFLWLFVISLTHKRAEGRAPVWGSELLKKTPHYMGIRRKLHLR